MHSTAKAVAHDRAVSATIGCRDDFIRLRIEASNFAQHAGEFLAPMMRGDANGRRWNQAATLFRRRMNGPAKTRARMPASGSTVLVSGTGVGLVPSTPKVSSKPPSEDSVFPHA